MHTAISSKLPPRKRNSQQDTIPLEKIMTLLTQIKTQPNNATAIERSIRSIHHSTMKQALKQLWDANAITRDGQNTFHITQKGSALLDYFHFINLNLTPGTKAHSLSRNDFLDNFDEREFPIPDSRPKKIRN
jgi:predicted transcriptional regulator